MWISCKRLQLMHPEESSDNTCDVRKYCPSFIMGVYEKIFFLVFEVSRTKYYLYQIFDTRYSFLMLMRSNLHGDISIIVFWGKVTDVKNFKYTYLLENLHVGRISLALEMSIWYQIFGTSNILFWTLQKLKKKFSHRRPL